MENSFMAVRKDLKNSPNQYVVGNIVSQQIKSFAQQLKRLNNRIVSENFLHAIRNLTLKVKNGQKSEQEFQNCIQYFLPQFSPTQNIFGEYKQLRLQKLKPYKLQIILPDFIVFKYHRYFSSGQKSFNDVWQHISDLLDICDLKPQTQFMKQVGKLYMLQHAKADPELFIREDKFQCFCEQVFGEFKKYDVIRQINNIHLKYPIQSDLNYQGRINLVVSGVPRSYQQFQYLKQGMNFQIWSFGLQESRRMCRDSLTIIGRYDQQFPFIDIPTPNEDTSIEKIHCAIISDQSLDPYVIDVSKKGNVYFSLGNQGKVKLERGMLILIAQNVLIEIEDIQNIQGEMQEQEFFQDPDLQEQVGLDIDSRMIIKHLTGPFKDSKSWFKTRDRYTPQKRTQFFIGKGGGGYAPYLFLPRETKVSTLHARVTFEDGVWYIQDWKSTNGTYLLLKNAKEYQNKQWSRPQKLFSEITQVPSNFMVLIVGNYKFFIRNENMGN